MHDPIPVLGVGDDQQLEESSPRSLLHSVTSSFHRTLPGHPPPQDFSKEVHLDLRCASNGALQRAADAIRATQATRSDVADADTVAFHLAFLAEEFAPKDPGLEPSLQHLEIYHSYLGRATPPPHLEEEHRRLVKRAEELLAEREKVEPHHLRSADTEGTRAMGAIVRVPMSRRRQTATLLALNFFTGLPLLITLFVAGCYISGALVGALAGGGNYGWYSAALYALWMLYDNRYGACRRLPAFSRISPWYKRIGMWAHLKNYFPMRVVRRPSSDFDPARNYLFCYHPHGVQSYGVWNTVPPAMDFHRLFPGLEMTVQTLPMNWWLPLMREHVTALGGGDASRGSIVRALTRRPGASTVLVTGGANESMLAHPHTAVVVLQGRVGFVRVAMSVGACLVPCWAFGENDVYENLAISNAGVRRWQLRMQKALSFAPVLVTGRGVFSYSGGVLPHRRPITLVVGDPIPLEKDEAALADAKSMPPATRKKIEEVHARYMAAVEELFNKYRGIYDPKCSDICFISPSEAHKAKVV